MLTEKEQRQLEKFNAVKALRESNPELTLEEAISNLHTSATTYYAGKELAGEPPERRTKRKYTKKPKMFTLEVPETQSTPAPTSDFNVTVLVVPSGKLGDVLKQINN